MTEPATDPRQALGARGLALRQNAGLTMETVAHAAGIHTNTLRGWERGRSAPFPWRLERWARALGVPVGALLAPDGWVVVSELRLQPSTVARLREGGRPVALELAALASQGLADEILNAVSRRARPRLNRDGRGKARRTRAEVLALIERHHQASADGPAGGGEGRLARGVGGLPPSGSDVPGSGSLSMLSD